MVVQIRWLRQGFISAGAWLFILICLSCLPARAAAPAQVTWDIPRLTQPPKIDGDLSEWTNIVPVFLGVEKDQIRYYSLRPWAGPLDSSARIWMGWDKDNLYFAADIRDDNFYQTCSSTDLGLIWSEDNLWLTVASPDKTKQDGTVERLNEINWAIVTSGRAAIVTKRGAEDYKAGAFPVAARKKPDGTGWICEGAVPWKEIPFSARAGAVVRLCWAVADSDTDSKVLSVPLSDIDANIEPKDLYTNDLIALVWPRAAGNYYKPWNFALAKLSDAPPPADSKIAEEAASRAYQDPLAGAKKLKPGEALLWKAHAQALLNQENFAQESYLRVLKEYPKGAAAEQASRALILLVEKTRGKQAALVLCEQMLNNSTKTSKATFPAVFEIANLKQGDEGFEAARQEMRRLIEKFPGSEIEAAAHYVTGCLYQREGLPEMAEAQWAHLVKIHSASKAAACARPQLANLRFDLALEANRVGDRLGSVKWMALVVKEPGWDKPPQDPLALYALWCRFLGNSGSPEWFEEAYKANIKLMDFRTNNNAKLLTRYDAAICLQGLKRHTEALKEFRAIVAAEPADQEIRELQEKCRGAMKESEDALAAKSPMPSGSENSVVPKGTQLPEILPKIKPTPKGSSK
jgi:hypothetical protein